MNHHLVGTIANITSFGLFISPIPTFFKIIKRKDVEHFSPNPALATFMNCAMWLLYGLPFVHPNNTHVWTVNGLGLMIEFLYIIIYLWYAKKTSKRLYVLGVLFAQLITIATIFLSLILPASHGTNKKRTLIFDMICVFVTTCMYAMPLDNAWAVWKTKSLEYMPLEMLVAYFCNGCIWVVYALLRFDINLLVSNGTGAYLGLLQLVFYTCVAMTYPQGMKKEGNNEIISLEKGEKWRKQC
ncbi:hypothetical protein ACHQM5_021291 [Ranunculus cassubicifolius]